VQRDRLKVDSLKWIASRLFPKRYGDKMELLGQDGGSSSTLAIKWLDSDQAPPRNERRSTAAMARRNRFIEIDGAGYA
jgi:hypothetical protein